MVATKTGALDTCKNSTLLSSEGEGQHIDGTCRKKREKKKEKEKNPQKTLAIKKIIIKWCLLARERQRESRKVVLTSQ